MKIPMLDLSEQYKTIKNEVLSVLDEVMGSSQFILGSNVKKLESDLASFSNVTHGVGVANGSDALHISLLGCGVKQGDEVIIPSFTFFATAGAVARIGAIPVFVDINPITYNINADLIEEKITDKTKAIIPVHLYGQMSEMDKIREIADKYNLFIIEDAAQAIGAKFKNMSPGEYSDTACYSFFPTKNLGAYGDAGMIVTKHKEVAEKMRVIRVHGSKPKYYHHVLGYNSRLDEMQAAILNVKFKHLDTWSNQRNKIAEFYTNEINQSLSNFIQTPIISDDCDHVFHQYTIRVKNRDELQVFLKENGVASMIYYPKPLHLQPVFKDLGYKDGDLPETEKAANEVLSLPMFPELKEEQQEYILEKLKKFFLEG